MGKHTHRVGAAALALAVCAYRADGVLAAAVVAGCAVAASRLPDRDGHYLKAGAPRSATHSVLLGAIGAWLLASWVPYGELLPAPLAAAAALAALGAALGWLSHLALDGLTVERVPLFLPGHGPKVGLKLTRTDDPGEYLVLLLLALSAGAVAALTWGGPLLAAAAAAAEHLPPVLARHLPGGAA
jgi:membrane-bound metal-dependent hydrolase YbcI (DUF457 family)